MKVMKEIAEMTFFKNSFNFFLKRAYNCIFMSYMHIFSLILRDQHEFCKNMPQNTILYCFFYPISPNDQKIYKKTCIVMNDLSDYACFRKSYSFLGNNKFFLGKHIIVLGNHMISY